MPNVVGLIPARGGSKGIIKKNLKEVNGDPLVGIAAQQGNEAELIDRTIVNSDDEEIRSVAESYGAEVMDRPDELAQDNSIVDELLQWCVTEIESQGGVIDIVVLLYPTAPLRTSTKIDEAISLVQGGNFDSALSLYEDDSYLWERDGNQATPVNYDPENRGPRQGEEWNQWVENKAIYVTGRDLLMETKCRLGGDVGFVEMPKWRSIDIDTLYDLQMANFYENNPPV